MTFLIYYHSDDYAFNIDHARRILSCRDKGALNSVSILANSACLAEAMEILPGDLAVSIHLNFCEGPCVADPARIPLLVDKRGYFCRSFAQMLVLSFTRHREVRRQLAIECSAQIRKVLSFLPDDYALRIDGHRHYHMIPAVFEAVYMAAQKTGRKTAYVRIPRDPWRIFLLHPRLLRHTRPLDIVKNLVLSALSFLNRRLYGRWKEPARAVFFGMMCAGEMTSERVRALLPFYEKQAAKEEKHLELMFHPGILLKGEPFLDPSSVHLPFYESENRNLGKR
ncbi:MAG: ChbG/HpnK family deacetylase [Lachnospiraceae bacterium]|nr:ChbG/HpnK family deacetylase [Lachnospiraceae bacterium]